MLGYTPAERDRDFLRRITLVMLRVALTVVVPVAFAVTVPAEAIAGRGHGAQLAGAVALACALLAFTRWFWKRGLRQYSGASA